MTQAATRPAVELKLVAYYRVSTKGQGASGLGEEGQREAVREYAAAKGGRLIAHFVEVESGRKDDRPELARAVTRAKRTGARLVVAKLDRMARSARFLLGLVESGVDVAFCDLPNIPTDPTGKFIVGIMAQVAELEAGLISGRTKTALAAYRAGKRLSKRTLAMYPEGVPPEVIEATAGKLGAELVQCRNLDPDARRKGQRLGTAAAKARADEQVDDLGPEVLQYRRKGMTLRAIAETLNRDNNQTRRGKPFTATAVLRLLNRAETGKA